MRALPGLLLATIIALRSAAATPTAAVEVKAVFLFNFTKFVEWPAGAFASARSPIVICVLGADPFDGALERAVAGEIVNGRPIEIRRFKSTADTPACHILYISGTIEERVTEVLGRLRRAPILTVADMDGFAARGGAVQFRSDGGRLRFEIRREAAESAGLKVDARVLALGGAKPRRPE